LRGGIYWADLDPTRGHEQSGKRPVLVLSGDAFNASSGTVLAVVLTSQEPRAPFPLTMEIKGSGLPKRSWVKISQIRTLSVQRLSGKIAQATPAEVERAIQGLGEIIGA
jgi:mRNA interferase MazF